MNHEHNAVQNQIGTLHRASRTSLRYTEGTALILSLRIKLSNPPISSRSDGSRVMRQREEVWGGGGGTSDKRRRGGMRRQAPGSVLFVPPPQCKRGEKKKKKREKTSGNQDSWRSPR